MLCIWLHILVTIISALLNIQSVIHSYYTYIIIPFFSFSS